MERGDKPAALATVERLKREYKGERPNLLLIRCLWGLGEQAEAVKLAGKELAERPDDLATIQVGSEIQESIGRGDRAEALIARALEANPKLPWARRRMALILSNRPNFARWAEARKLVEPLGAATADSPPDRMIRATVLERGPDPSSTSEAIAVYRSLAEDLPLSHPIGRKARSNLGRLLLASGDRAGAADAIVPAASDSASPDAPMLAIAIEALALEGKATKANPSAIHHIHLARAYALAGKTDLRARSLSAARLASVKPDDLEPEDRAELEAGTPHR